jgi:16S rRNA (cytosine1407-C5)-methyltransferase
MIHSKKNNELEIYLKNLFKKEYNEFINSSPEPVSIRINTLKTTVKDFLLKLESWNQQYENLIFQPAGFTLRKDSLPLSHTLDYFRGSFFYQGASSQIPVELLDIQSGQMILDMAAAPGSKSCQILNKLNNKGFLVINDFSYKRMQPLNVNVQRTGAANYYILNTWGEQLGQYYHEYFDKVLLDAPCTALGTLVSSNEVINWWSIKKLNKLTKSQYALLISGLKTLKVGGELVYSTCSVAPEENEIIIQKILNVYPVEIVESPKKLQNIFSNGIMSYQNVELPEEIKRAIRVYPHQHGYEGFFAIKLRKTGTIKKKKYNNNLQSKKLLKWNDPTIINVLNEISDTWGIEESFWQTFNYNLTKNKIWIVKEINQIPIKNLVSSGLLLAEKKLSGWKLFNNSVTFLGSKIKKRTFELEDNNLILLFKNSILDMDGIEDGYYAITRNQIPFASVYVNKNRVHVRLPHSFNLVLD